MTATNAQLMANGYPPEPSASDPSGVEAWQNAVSHAISWSSPAPVYICDTSGSSIYNGVWAGHLANTSAYGNINFLETYSVWTQHSVPTDPNYDDDDYSLAPAVSSWTGLGYADILQAGVRSISADPPMYEAWVEDFPADLMAYTGSPAIAPGDQIYVSVTYLGDDQTYFFIENETTDQVYNRVGDTPDVGLLHADFLIERSVANYLPPFGRTEVSDNGFCNSNWVCYGLTTDSDTYVMTSDCASNGVLLSEPSEVDNSNNSFYQVFHNKSPWSNTCGVSGNP
jgi:hypothetical protein